MPGSGPRRSPSAANRPGPRGPVSLLQVIQTSSVAATEGPAIVVQMLASGAIGKRGGVLQERDVPADLFLDEVEKRGIKIDYAIE